MSASPPSSSSTTTTPIKLFSLPNSRSIRIAWLLEELQLPYDLVSTTRQPDHDVPPSFRDQAGGLGKAPTLHDGALRVQESGAIVQYLCTTYPSPDPAAPLLPPAPADVRWKVVEYLHLAEGAFALHAAPLFYARRARLPGREGDEMFAGVEERVLRKVRQDLDWLEGELVEQQRRLEDVGDGLGEEKEVYLVGRHLTAADVVMGFVVGLCLERVTNVNERGEGYGAIGEWMQTLMKRKALRTAMKKLDFKY